MLAEDDCWTAVLARDRAFDGRFVTGVLTTGIYCRPSCAARHPARMNVRFFADGVAARAAIAGVVWGVALYGAYTFVWQPAGLIGLHYIDFMVVTLATSVLFALGFNRAVLGRTASFTGWRGVTGATA